MVAVACDQAGAAHSESAARMASAIGRSGRSGERVGEWHKERDREGRVIAIIR
ncbi:hypothetical protein GCM10027214_19330 [Stenotrophomonas tumulicola]